MVLKSIFSNLSLDFCLKHEIVQNNGKKLGFKILQHSLFTFNYLHNFLIKRVIFKVMIQNCYLILYIPPTIFNILLHA